MNDKKKILIVAKSKPTTGIGATVVQYFRNILFAAEKGYIPVVDMKHYTNQYFKDGRTFKDNAWEYFFEQPCGYTLEDIDDSCECTIDRSTIAETRKNLVVVDMLPSTPKEKVSEKLTYLKQQFKKYIKFNQSTMKYATDKYNEIIQGDDNILGVLVRGTDYTVRRSYKEPIQPDIKDVIKKIYEYLKKYPNITKIYVATEDEDLFQSLKKEFGDRLLDNGQYRYSYKDKKDKVIADIVVNRADHNFTLALEYLSSIYILCKCKYFIGGLNGGTRLAYLFQDNWEDFFIYHLGRYGKTFKESLFSFVHVKCKGINYKMLKIMGIKIKVKKY